MLWYSLPEQGSALEYTQHLFLWRNCKTNISIFFGEQNFLFESWLYFISLSGLANLVISTIFTHASL